MAFRWMMVLIAFYFQVTNAHAACVIFGDSIGVGLGRALNGTCPTTAEVGILSSIVAARVTPGDRWTIVSLGSNDFPTGLSPQMKMYSQARVEKALDEVDTKVGKRLILILPANEAHLVVKNWADKHNVPTIGFEPGADGVHPRKPAYDAMASKIEEMIKN